MQADKGSLTEAQAKRKISDYESKLNPAYA